MSLFVVISWALCLSTSVLLFNILRRARHFAVKPSMIVVFGFHVMIQWAATLNAEMIEHFLIDPYAFLVLTQLFPMITATCVTFFGRAQSEAIWERIIKVGQGSDIEYWRPIGMLFVMFGIVTAGYLNHIPFANTGLYMIFVDPENSAVAREESLKLIDSELLKYGFVFMASAISPLIATMSMLTGIRALSRREVHLLPVLVGLFLVLLLGSGLTGARGFGATIVLAAVYAAFLRRGLPLNPAFILPAAFAVLILPVLLTIQREGLNFSFSLFTTYLMEGIADRVFIVPMETGLWFADYAQTQGFIGIAGIPKIANFFGVDGVNANNVIGLRYMDSYISSVNANTSFVFSYYSFFGIIAFPVCIALTLLLDLAIKVYERLDDRILVPCVAAASVSCLSFVSADYTTVLITHGFGVILIISSLVGKLLGVKMSPGAGA